MTSDHYQGLRFLIVDNIKPSQDILKQFVMRLTSKQVDSSHYAQDVTAICQQKEYDVILLGYDLGENQKNGQQILEELRINNHISRHCIVILITAEISQAMVLAALEHKPDDYLCKPYSLNDLDKRLTKCLKKKQAMSSVYQALEIGDPNLVIEFCDQALAKNTPYKTECLGIKSRQFYELEQYERAKEIYERYKDTANCQWASVGLGKVALHEERLMNAEAIFKSLIKKHPLYLSSYDWLAITYQKQFNFIFAEEILEQALKLSPRSIPRLKKYAKQCLDNHHFEKATFAYEQTYKLAHNSIHHSPENAIMFAKALMEYSPTLPLVDAKKINNRAYGYLNQMNKDFKQHDVKIQSHLLSACLLETTRDFDIAKNEIDSGEKLLNKEINAIDKSVLKDISNTLVKLNRPSIPSELLISQSEGDKEVSYPVSNRDKAQEAIAKGQELYDNKEYALAIKQLTTAQALYPKHVGIKLNLIQALLLSYEHSNKNIAHLTYAQSLLTQLNDMKIPNEELNRLKKMQKKYQHIAGI
ncbi:response regulator [Litorilituus lipolyticus]|uniref:Response regulator n=1 Tax=Litorilituus lipolyticus TaxID=2491017 RepID=A0A502KTX9_9GAMM|nr:response regulator [Litorilituus lipolyticus]TPH13675.1 response regulator [Litorilituus lipolyticus]